MNSIYITLTCILLVKIKYFNYLGKIRIYNNNYLFMFMKFISKKKYYLNFLLVPTGEIALEVLSWPKNIVKCSFHVNVAKWSKFTMLVFNLKTKRQN